MKTQVSTLADHVYENIETVLSQTKRSLEDIKIVLVTKAQPNAAVLDFLATQKPYWACGESYLDEMLEKQKTLSAAPHSLSLNWHFLGRLQSRKLVQIIQSVKCLHSVSRVKELEIIATTPIDFFVQVNVSSEASKNGFDPAQAQLINETVERLNLQKHFKGIMAMPSAIEDVGEAELRKQLQKLYKLREQHFTHKLLNVGTSQDYKWALLEGSDVVRLGSCLLGERDYS